MPKRTSHLIALTAGALALGSCAQPELAAIPTAPAAVAQAVAALATVLPAGTPAPRLPTQPPQEATVTAVAPKQQAPEAVPTPSPSLLDLAPGETLVLLEDIPIARTDFGVRMAFSPGSDALLHNGNGLAVQQFDLERGEALGELTGFNYFSPFTISVSPDGLAVVADDGPQIQVWKSDTGERVATLALAPFSLVSNAGFHADDLFFAVDSDGNIAIWDPNGWHEISQFSHPGQIVAGIFFPDGSAIALQDRKQQEIGIFDLQGTRLGTLPVVRENDLLLSVSPGGDRLLLHVDYGYPTEGVRIIAVETGETLLELPLLNFRYFAISPDWSLLAAVGVQNELRLYHLPGGELLLAQPLGVARTLGISMSADTEYLAFYVFKTGDQGAAIQVWGRGSEGS